MTYKKMICLLLALVLTFTGCHTAIPGTTAGSVPPQGSESTGVVLGQSNWNMKLALVDSNGNVIETGETQAKVSFDTCSDYQYNCSFAFRYLDTAYSMSCAVRMKPKDPASGKYSYGFPSGTQFKDGDEKGVMFYMGLDPEKQCFILDADDGKDTYLIGYTDPNTNLADLWQYFQGFIEQRPAEFPEIVDR